MFKIPLKLLPIMGIILLFAVIGLFLIRTGHRGLVDPILKEIPLGEGLRLKNIHYTQNNPDDTIKWVLDADEVLFSKDRQRISFNRFRLKLEIEDSPSVELEGDKGNYNKETDEINLWGDLRGRAENGYSISTERITYKQKEGCLKTDDPVRITGPFFSVAGRGLFLDLKKETLRIDSDATTLIEKGSFIL
jgi:LPS export ABC transporter protein LptC